MRQLFATCLLFACWVFCQPAALAAAPQETAPPGTAPQEATSQEAASRGAVPASPATLPAAAVSPAPREAIPPKAAAPHNSGQNRTAYDDQTDPPARTAPRNRTNPDRDALSPAAPATAASTEDDGWTIMPAGARPTYMGIHGGTMPVSLLVYGDGSSLVTFVGRTGNDFLEILRRTDLPVPSLLNATARPVGAPLPTANGTGLMAGNAADSIPVLSLPGGILSGTALKSGLLQPFGLSDKPLSIEGQVTRPPHLTPVRQYRLLFRPQYLQPRRTPR